MEGTSVKGNYIVVSRALWEKNNKVPDKSLSKLSIYQILLILINIQRSRKSVNPLTKKEITGVIPTYKNIHFPEWNKNERMFLYIYLVTTRLNV